MRHCPPYIFQFFAAAGIAYESCAREMPGDKETSFHLHLELGFLFLLYTAHIHVQNTSKDQLIYSDNFTYDMKLLKGLSLRDYPFPYALLGHMDLIEWNTLIRIPLYGLEC